MKNMHRGLLTACLLTMLAAPAAAYTVILKDGAQLIAQAAPTITGDRAIIVLQSGTRTSIAASEIDVERTREANQHELGSAMVLEGGEFTSRPTQQDEVREERLSDLIAKGRTGGRANRTPITRDSPGRSSSRDSLADHQRTPYRNLEVLEAIQGAFKSQGVDGAKVYEGTTPNRLLIEVETDSEAAVFRTIKVAAGSLSHVRANISARIEAFELVLATSNRSNAGQFLMTTDDATDIVGGDVEISSYFINNVLF